MAETPEVILKLGVDSAGVFTEIDKVKAKYGEVASAVRENKIQLSQLLAEEKKLLQLRSQTTNPTAVVQYNAKLKETRDGINKINVELAKQNSELKETKTQATGTGAALGKAFDTTAAVSLRSQLRLLKEDLANATDPDEINRLAIAAGSLEDKIGDASNASRVFATESGFESVSTALGDVGRKILSLDFKGAADSSKLLLRAIQGLTFGEVIKSVKDLGTTLLNVGRALLANPLFLMAALITGIVFALKEYNDSLKENTEVIKENNAAIEKIKENVKTLADEYDKAVERQLVAQGLLTDADVKRGAALEKFAALQRKQNADLIEAAKKFREEIGVDDASTIESKLRKQAELNKRLKELATAQARELAQAGRNLNEEISAINTEAFEADKQRREKESADRLKALEAQQKQLRDLEASNITDQFDRLRAQLTIKYNDDFKAAKGNSALILELRRELDKNIKAVDDAEVKSNKAKLDKIQKQVEDANAENLADFFKTEQERANILQASVSEEQRHQRVLLGVKLEGNKLASQILLASDIADAEVQLKLLESSGIATEAEIKAQNNKIIELKAQLSGELLKLDEKEKEELKAALKNLLQTSLSDANQLIDAQISNLDKLTAAQQKRVDDATKIAENGNSQLLELEKKRLDDLNKEKEKFVRAQQALAAIELVAETAVMIAKAGAEGGAAAGVTIAAAIIALIAGLASARSIAGQAAFYEGGYTGDGNPKEESTAQGVRGYKYHKEEFIHNHQTTRKYLKHFRDIHSGKMDLNEVVQHANLYKMLNMRGIDMNREVMPKQNNQSYSDINELKSLMRDTTDAIKGQQRVSVRIDENGLAIIATNYINKQNRLNNLSR